MAASDLDDDTGSGASGGTPPSAGPLSFFKDILWGVGIVIVLVAMLFLISGVWPPFVAVESGSMEPHIDEGDLIFLVETDRFFSLTGSDTGGLITHEEGQALDHVAFGKAGHVVVFQADGQPGTPIIHRLHFWVEAGENWYDRADQEYIRDYDDCDELPNCPAPHEGYITKGDYNTAYDQVSGQSTVVKQEWIESRALVRIPWLGHLRLSY